MRGLVLIYSCTTVRIFILTDAFDVETLVTLLKTVRLMPRCSRLITRSRVLLNHTPVACVSQPVAQVGKQCGGQATHGALVAVHEGEKAGSLCSSKALEATQTHG